MVGRIRTCTSVQRKDLAVEGEVARWKGGERWMRLRLVYGGPSSRCPSPYLYSTGSFLIPTCRWNRCAKNSVGVTLL